MKNKVVNALKDSKYIFNAAPVAKSNQLVESKLKKKKMREKKQLQKRAELAEYISSDEDNLPPQPTQLDQDLYYDQLGDLDQDILGFFQMKAQKIIASTKKIPDRIFDIDSMHLGAVNSIGPNGAYLIVNFTRNKKGFIDQHNLRDRKSVSGANYRVGEYVLCKVIDEPKSNKAQLTIMPSAINAELRLKDVVPGMHLSAIAAQANEFGIQLNFGAKDFTGFINDATLKLGRVYIVSVKNINLKEKIVTCDFEPRPIDTLKKSQISPFILHPGNLWPCTVVSQVDGGAVAKLDKFGAVGYIFQDYVDEQEKTTCRIIGFDAKTRQVYLSSRQEHKELAMYNPPYKMGDTFPGLRVQQPLFSGAYIVNLFLNVTPDNEQQKKVKKALKNKERPLGASAFLHGSQIPEDVEIEGDYNRRCMIQSINYFDHAGTISFEIKQRESLADLKVGELIKGQIKQVLLKDNKCSVIVTFKDKFSGVIPHEQMSDYVLQIAPKFRIGNKIRARILSIDEKSNNITLTIKPTLLTDIKVFASLQEVKAADTLYGFVCKKLENGILVKFFQDIVGFLSHQSLDGQSQEDIQMGQIIKVYVKYVNTEQNKLILSLKKVDPKDKELRSKPEPNESSKPNIQKEVAKKKKKIEIGAMLSCVVTAIKNNVVYVNLPEGKFGRVHKAFFECYDNESRFFKLQSEFENLNVGSLINCQVIGQSNENQKTIYELTCLQNHISLTNDPEQDQNKEVIGIVKQVKSDTMGVLTVQINYKQNVVIDGWDCGLEDGDLINQLESLVNLGDPVRVKLILDSTGKKLKGTLGERDLKQQDILYTKQTFRVVSLHESYLRVQLRNRQFASVDITEVNENWQLNVFDRYQIGKWGTCRIIAKENVYWASLRETFLNDKLWIKCLHPIKSTQLSFNKLILSQKYDVRTLLYKKQPLKIGQVVIGYVTGSTYNGCFVKIGYNTTCLIRGYQPEIKYRPIILMLTKLDKLQGTVDLEMLKYQFCDKSLRVGDIVDGIIVNVKNERAAVKILGTLASGELVKSNAQGADSEEGWWANKLFKLRSKVQCLIIGQRQNRQGETVMKLTNLKEIIETEGKRKIELGDVQEDVVEIYQSFQQMVAEHQSKAKDLMKEQSYNKNEKQIEEELAENPNVEAHESADQENGDEEEQEVEAEGSDAEQQNDNNQGQESEVQIEQAQLDSRAEYEKQILGNPNSSVLWIEFVAFVAENEGIESARSVMERALRVINFANETERLNLWTAYLNLEHNFGSEENLISVFKRGCQNCDSKKLHQKLINIYRRAEKEDLAVELSRSFTQKFKQSSKSWMEFLQCLMMWQKKHNDENPQYSYKDVLHRAMQSLAKKKQTKLLAYFGRLQFQNNQIEEGKTTLETLLKQNPQRTDIWTQYIDLTIKYCSADVVRLTIRKALEANKKPRKIKGLFKKQLEFETQYGTEETVSKVREEAQRWVQNYMQKQDEAEGEEEQGEEVESD